MGFTEVAIPPKISPRFLRHPTKIRAEKFLRAEIEFGKPKCNEVSVKIYNYPHPEFLITLHSPK